MPDPTATIAPSPLLPLLFPFVPLATILPMLPIYLAVKLDASLYLITPGLTVLTRMLYGATSRAKPTVNVLIAAFEAA